MSHAPASKLDLNKIEADLTDVDAALGRLEAGTYFTDEVTGQQLSEELLTNNPIARRA
jgi:RNA polymerase-binding transcription factor DksA